MSIKLIITLALLSISLSAISVGEITPRVIINAEDGGVVKNNGGMWDSDCMKNSLILLFYVDPDEKDTNTHFTDILKEKKYDKTKYKSIAVINLAATWKPNFILESILESKQKEFPSTIYVKDKNSILVDKWKLKDNSSEVLILSEDSKVLFYKSGKLDKKDIVKAIKIIEERL